MSKLRKRGILLLGFLLLLQFSGKLAAQDTQILGFVAAEMFYEDEILNFGFGEQDLFITSQLNDNFSFLGETVFKFSPDSPTEFNASVERIIIAYNYIGNHSILYGKHHTPFNYWNATYHHGRVFFPTIARPLLFNDDIGPIHTVGIELQGFNLGPSRFGYNLMVGNGLGSHEVSDNDKAKSITAAVHIKPWDSWYFGASIYSDKISAGADLHGNIIPEQTDQQLFTASVAHFGPRFELLAESTIASNDANSTGQLTSYASYVYGGVRLKEKWVPYMRFDLLEYEPGEFVFQGEDTISIIGGLRYEVNYLIVLKMEYQHIDRDITGGSDILNAQIAVGF